MSDHNKYERLPTLIIDPNGLSVSPEKEEMQPLWDEGLGVGEIMSSCSCKVPIVRGGPFPEVTTSTSGRLQWPGGTAAGINL
jgi:hypothetical protein